MPVTLYVLLRLLHIGGAILLFGTGLGTAFHGWMAFRCGRPEVVAAVARSVVLADWLFTAPAAALQPVTGLLLAREAGHDLASPWLAAAACLYLLVGACWLPVVWLQIRMARMSREAVAAGTGLPAAYWRYSRLWFLLGVPAFLAMVAILWLMVAKPI